MKAVTVKQAGGADQLQLVEQKKPVPGKGELLIKVAAAAVNRTDIVSREGRAGYLRNPILGVEVSGTVEQAGAATKTAPGSPVMGLVNGGGYAQYALMPEERAIRIPEQFSFEEAAAIPEVFLTAYQTLFWIGRLDQRETVLVHAGGSGVGTAAIQLARQLAQARVITTAGSQRKLDFCRSLGAEFSINYKEEAFDREVLKATGDRGADLILDFIGASYWSKNLASIGVDGRWVLIGILGGAEIEKLQLFDLMSKRIQLTGTLLTPRSDAYKAALTAEFSARCMPLFKEGKLRPVLDRVFPLEQVRQAHEYMEDNRNIGKIVLRVG